MTVFGMDRLGQEHIPADNTQVFLWHYFLCITVMPTDCKQDSVYASSRGYQGSNTRYYFMATMICKFLKTVQCDLFELASRFIFSVLFVNNSFAGASRKNEDRCSEHHLLFGD
jgi:hypothetical protein